MVIKLGEKYYLYVAPWRICLSQSTGRDSRSEKAHKGTEACFIIITIELSLLYRA